MTTPPSEVRTGLTVVTAAAAADLANSAASVTTDPAGALLEIVPGLIDFYLDASSELALEWYEELREDAAPRRPFMPQPHGGLRLQLIESQVAETARQIHREVEQEAARLTTAFAREVDLMVERLTPVVVEEVANGFRDTITENVKRDPAAVGWKRHARPEACKFCKMLAARGAVYTEATARFAAHGATVDGKKRGGDCMCIAGPEFGGLEIWAEATPMQYMASQKVRTAKQRAKLREYLNENFPDAPG